MKVAELIKKLEGMPPDADVVVPDRTGMGGWWEVAVHDPIKAVLVRTPDRCFIYHWWPPGWFYMPAGDREDRQIVVVE